MLTKSVFSISLSLSVDSKFIGFNYNSVVSVLSIPGRSESVSSFVCA